MKKVIKIIVLVIVAILVLAGAYYAKVYFSTEARIHKDYSHVIPQQLPADADSAMLANGARLVVSKGCTECHSGDLGGKVFIDDPALGFIVARNLTKGNGGLPDNFSRQDWILALKHGLNPSKRPLLIMPAHEYTHLSEYDMLSIIGFCEQLSPVDRVLPASTVGPLGRFLTDIGKIDLLPAEKIDHDKLLVKEVKAEATVEFGKYLSIACQGCHREHMQGGEPIAPGFPVVANISSTGNPGKWTTDQFIQTLRTGVTPEGKKLNPKDMPWTMTKAYTDTELTALHLYLKTK